MIFTDSTRTCLPRLQWASQRGHVLTRRTNYSGDSGIIQRQTIIKKIANKHNDAGPGFHSSTIICWVVVGEHHLLKRAVRTAVCAVALRQSWNQSEIRNGHMVGPNVTIKWLLLQPNTDTELVTDWLVVLIVVCLQTCVNVWRVLRGLKCLSLDKYGLLSGAYH